MNTIPARILNVRTIRDRIRRYLNTQFPYMHAVSHRRQVALLYIRYSAMVGTKGPPRIDFKNH